MIRAGEDPNAPRTVRPGLISNEPVQYPPLVAAAAARRPEVIELLLGLGARLDDRSWDAAWCVSESDDVRQALHRHVPRPAPGNCAEVVQSISH
jgi:hypothetical protein